MIDWLMIVSIAMVVLPVWRSPMISSRCPRPIGIIASIALIPVCKGTFTSNLSITPGAIRSTILVFVALTGPRLSIGCPVGSTTLPKSSSPTGTSAIRPVRFTGSPSEMWLSGPSNTAPILSSSRFKAIPYSSPGNSRSSPLMALLSP